MNTIPEAVLSIGGFSKILRNVPFEYIKRGRIEVQVPNKLLPVEVEDKIPKLIPFKRITFVLKHVDNHPTLSMPIKAYFEADI